MNFKVWKGTLVVGISIALGVAGGYWLAQPRMSEVAGVEPDQEAKASPDRKVLYWYDPMYPQQKFDKPGKSPFMDMQMIPQYADTKGDGTLQSFRPVRRVLSSACTPMHLVMC
jgi:Cu(I)/Ag(I) efflux system membrane fusion protein